MHQASVGFHCPECTRSGAQKVHTARSLSRVPMLVRVLIGLNLAVFVLDVVLSQGRSLSGMGPLAVDGGLIALALNNEGQLIGVADGEWYRLVTSGFLHYGLLHLGFNMYALYLLGGIIERELDTIRFGMIYLVSLLVGSLGALLLSPNSLTAGASGAIFGLMGAALVLERYRGIPIRSSGIVGLLVINLLLTFSLSRYISVGGHVGGLAGGIVTPAILLEVGRRTRNKALPVALCGALAVGVAVAAVAVAEAAVS